MTLYHSKYFSHPGSLCRSLLRRVNETREKDYIKISSKRLEIVNCLVRKTPLIGFEFLQITVGY